MIEIPYLGNLDKAEIYGVSDLHSEDILYDDGLQLSYSLSAVVMTEEIL